MTFCVKVERRQADVHDFISEGDFSLQLKDGHIVLVRFGLVIFMSGDFVNQEIFPVSIGHVKVVLAEPYDDVLGNFTVKNVKNQIISTHFNAFLT